MEIKERYNKDLYWLSTALLHTLPGVFIKNILIGDEYVQVVHDFESTEHIQAYLTITIPT